MHSHINVSFQRSLPDSLLLSFHLNLYISVCLSRYPTHTHRATLSLSTKLIQNLTHSLALSLLCNAFPVITPSAHQQPLRLESHRTLWKLLSVPFNRAPMAVCKMERGHGRTLLRNWWAICTGIKMHSRQILPTGRPPPSKRIPVHGLKQVTIQAGSGHQPWQLQAMERVPDAMDWLGFLHVQRWGNSGI